MSVQWKELGMAIAATLILPLGVIGLDYFIRAKMGKGTFSQLTARSGPDCCILSLGATGAIFLDPHVNAALGASYPLLIVFLVLLLMGLRFACLDPNELDTDSKESPNLRYGLFSVLTVFLVMVYGYALRTPK